MKHILFIAIAVCMYVNLSAQIPTLDWAKRIGGSGYDVCFSSTLDAAGNIYTTGHFDGTVDFDPGAGVFNLTAIGPYDNYVCKLDNSGNFVWARQMGGTAINDGFSITNGAAGNIYVTGIFQGTTDFDPGAGVFNLTSMGMDDIFVLKLDSAGNFKWAASMGGPNDDYGYGIAVSDSGNVYTTGYFEGTVDFDPGSGTYNLTSAGGTGSGRDAFISKLDASGNFIWAKQFGAEVFGRSITIDSMENVFMAGSFSAANSFGVDFDPGPGTYYLDGISYPNTFILKLNASGNFVWAKRFQAAGPVGSNIAHSITTDALGNVYTTGEFEGSVDFDPDTNYIAVNGSGGNDIFVSKLDSGGHFVWAKSFIGFSFPDDWGRGLSIATDAAGNVYTTGIFDWTVDFDPGPGNYNLTSTPPFEDMFVSKLDASGNFVWAYKNDGGINCDGQSINVDEAGNIYTTGYFSGITDFDPDSNSTFNLSSAGQQNIFVVKLHDTPTGIIENTPTSEIKTFPNPTNGDFIIQTGKPYNDVVVRVINVTGQEVFNATYHNTNRLNITLLVPSGVYVAEMRSFGGLIGRVKVVLN